MVLALGYASAVLIGILLGLMGGGGAIIVVPVLVYLFHKDAVTATAYSLFIVSIAAFVGFLRNLAKGLVDVRTGLIGVGGGFLIVPALVLLANVPMKKAVGTSLMIIAIKSMIGFVGDLNAGLEPEWQFLLIFSGLALSGIFIGTWLGTLISGAKLKKLFGWFVLAMAVFITAQLLAG